MQSLLNLLKLSFSFHLLSISAGSAGTLPLAPARYAYLVEMLIFVIRTFLNGDAYRRTLQRFIVQYYLNIIGRSDHIDFLQVLRVVLGYYLNYFCKVCVICAQPIRRHIIVLLLLGIYRPQCSAASEGKCIKAVVASN